MAEHSGASRSRSSLSKRGLARPMSWLTATFKSSHYCAVKPPSTSRLWPVTNDDLLDENQMAASAISSDLPMRPMGCMAVTCARN